MMIFESYGYDIMYKTFVRWVLVATSKLKDIIEIDLYNELIFIVITWLRYKVSILFI